MNLEKCLKTLGKEKIELLAVEYQMDIQHTSMKQIIEQLIESLTHEDYYRYLLLSCSNEEYTAISNLIEQKPVEHESDLDFFKSTFVVFEIEKEQIVCSEFVKFYLFSKSDAFLNSVMHYKVVRNFLNNCVQKYGKIEINDVFYIYEQLNLPVVTKSVLLNLITLPIRHHCAYVYEDPYLIHLNYNKNNQNEFVNFDKFEPINTTEFLQS